MTFKNVELSEPQHFLFFLIIILGIRLIFLPDKYNIAVLPKHNIYDVYLLYYTEVFPDIIIYPPNIICTSSAGVVSSIFFSPTNLPLLNITARSATAKT